MTVFEKFPPELCRDKADMNEMIKRAVDSQFWPRRLGKIIQKARFEEDGSGSVRARSLTPLYRKDALNLSPIVLGKEEDDGWIEIEVTIDSGAYNTVMPTALCPNISILQT